MAARALSSLPIPTSSFASRGKPSATTSSSSPFPPRFLRLRTQLLFPDPLLLSFRTLFLSRPRGTSPAPAMVLSMLPTSKPEGASPEKIPKWSARAIKSFSMAELEARKLKYPKTGTEALLMGILVEGTSHAAKFLRENGISLFKVREEAVKLLGKSDLYFFSPEHPPLTEPAQRALDWAADEKIKSGEDGEITTAHMLLGIWSEKDSAGHKILASLGFNDEKAAELAKSANQDAVMSYR